MSNFPHKIWGDFGDEKVTSASKIGSLPLGTRMELPDGRVFAHAKSSATAQIAGTLVKQKETTDAQTKFELAVAANAAVGATSVTLTIGGTAVTVDQYTDGYIFVNDDAGEGEIYKIKSSASAAISASCVFTLADGDTVTTAIASGTSVAGLCYNEFDGVEVWKSGTLTSMPVGVAPIAATASHYFWVQRRGPVNVLCANTIGATGAQVVPGSEEAEALKT